LVGNVKERDHLVDLYVIGRIILEFIINKYERKSLNWIKLTQDRVQWRILVNKVMNIWIP
jgi:hypothetical protein